MQPVKNVAPLISPEAARAQLVRRAGDLDQTGEQHPRPLPRVRKG